MAYKGLHSVTRGRRKLERFTGFRRGYRGLQGLAGGCRGLQGFTKGYSGLQEVTYSRFGRTIITNTYNTTALIHTIKQNIKSCNAKRLTRSNQ